MHRLLIRFMVACCVMMVFSGRAGADEFHYTNLLIGDRASGMGGAYTAISDDATGLYYNPAGIAYTTGRSLAASVNAFYNTKKTYRSVIGGNGWERKSSALLPNYFGVTQPLGRFKVGFSYAVPEAIMEDQAQTFHNLQLGESIRNLPENAGAVISTYVINFNNESNTYNLGPSISTELTKNFSTGLTLYYFQHKNLTILNQIIKTSNGGYELSNFYKHVNETGLRPVLGFMWSPVDRVSLGLALSKVYILNSSTSFQSTYRRQGFGVFDSASNAVITDTASLPDGPSSTNVKRTTPKQVSFGVAWFSSASLLVTADVNYFSAKNVEDMVAFRGHAKSNIEDVANISVGTEYYLNRSWALRGGMYTDYANTPKLRPDRTDQDEHIDLYGATASVSHFNRDTSVTLGAGATTGKGRSQIVSGVQKSQEADSTGWMIFLSSSYSY